MSRGAPAAWRLIVTAEHGGNEVPAECRDLFGGHEAELHSHRGWDPGTLPLAERLAAALDAPLVAARTTRLLVDLNRSAHNPRVFSDVTRSLPRAERESLVDRYHRPHWERAREAVARGITEQGRVLHLGVHSFTPVLDGRVRRPDLALLYDPARPRERKVATAWAAALADALPERTVRRNNPYRGAADGMTTAFRRSFPEALYLGLEIEVNQRHLGPDGSFPTWVHEALLATLKDLLGR